MRRQKGDNVELKETIQHTADLRKNLLNWSHLIKTEVDNINSKLKSVEEKLEVINSQDGISYESVNLEATKLQLLSDRRTILIAMNAVFADLKVLKNQVSDSEMEKLQVTIPAFLRSQSNRN